MKHDAKTLDKLVATDFAGVGHDGQLVNKAALLSQTGNDKDTYSATSLSDMKVHVFAPNVAVVIGDAHEKGNGKDGKAFNRTFRFTDTWVERNSKWKCVAEQVAQIAGK